MTKLTDVAKKAGVSPTTVSRVLNNRGYISNETKIKVKNAMKELNYHPNNIARSLGGKSTHIIGLIFYDTSHPFFGELISKLESMLFKKGYKVFLCNSANSSEKEKRYLDMLSANKVDGIISGTHNLDILEYQNIQAPIVSFDRNLAPFIPVVSSDNFKGGVKATEYLINQGAKDVHIISSHLHSHNPTDARVEGYFATLKQHNLIPHEHAFSFTMSPTIKKELIKKILQSESIDGLFCTDDLTAILAYEAAQELGIKVPKDLNLIGYDGTSLIRNYFPQLSTIQQPIEEISNLLIELLLKQIDGYKPEKNETFKLPVKLIVGD